jgi:hypothetical protein
MVTPRFSTSTLTRQHAIVEHADREGAFARDRDPAIDATR